MSQKKVSVFMGGTGANNAADARALLGAVSLSGDTMTGNLNVAATLITQNVIPNANVTYDLGSSEARFKDLWLSNSTIYLGEASISSNGNALVVPAIETDSGVNLEAEIAVVYAQANSAYDAANNRVLKAGDTMTGVLNVANTLLVTGNVGIGTSSPSVELHLKGNDREALRLETTGNVSSSGFVFQRFNDVNGSAAYIGFGGVANTFDINSYKSGSIRFATVDSERMRIDETGNVNIGVTGFLERLVVAAPGTSNNVTFWMLGTNDFGGASNGVKLKALGSQSSSGAGTFTIETRSTDLNYYEHFRITSNGNVGIGTTSPNVKLAIIGTAAASASTSQDNGIFIVGSTNGVQLQFTSLVNSPYGIALQTKDSNNAGPYNYPLLLQPVNGGVSIGTTSVTKKLSVYETNNTGAGTTTFWNFTFGGMEISNPSTTANTVAGIAFSGGTSRTSVSGIGNILESTTLGALGFFTGGSGISGGTVPERMRITSSGIITTPYQPSFSAYLSGAYTHPSGVVGALGGTWATHHNTGGHYSTSTRKFTAPVSGVYVFQCIIATEGGAGSFNYLSAELWVNGSRVRIGGWGCGGAGGSYGETASSYVVYMNANDYAEFGSESNKSFNVQNGGGNTMFAGYLLG